MTKKEITIIKEKEADAWVRLQEARREYVKEHFPAGYGYLNAESTDYAKNDVTIWGLLNEWSAIAEIMDDLGIESDFNEEAHDIYTDFWEYLEACGKYVSEEAPTEDEEVTEENPDKYHDIETDEIITERELWEEYDNSDERHEMTFGQYRNNCLTINGGTLERI